MLNMPHLVSKELNAKINKRNLITLKILCSKGHEVKGENIIEENTIAAIH